MAEFITAGTCAKCGEKGLFLDYRYKNEDLCVEFRLCGFFGEIISWYYFKDPEEEKAWFDLHFKKKTGNLFKAMKPWGILPLFTKSGYMSWLHRINNETRTFYVREGYIKKQWTAWDL